MIHVFGGDDFLTRATNRLGLRGFVLDTKLGPRYGVSQPVVLAKIPQDVSGKCVAGMISPPRQHTSCSPKAISSAAQTCFIVLEDRRYWNFRVNRGCGMCRKSKLSRHRLGWSWPLQISEMFWDGWTLQCVWTKHIHPKASALDVTTPTHHACLSRLP